MMVFLRFYIFLFLNVFHNICLASEYEKYIGLKEVIEEAMSGDTYVKSANHERLIGEARREEAFGQFLPQISANISSQKVNRNEIGYQTKIDGDRKSIEIHQVIYDASIFNNYKKNKFYAEQSKINYEDVRLKRIFYVVEKYFNLLEKKEAVELLKKEIYVNDINLKKMNRLLEKQMAKITDVLSFSSNNDILKVSLIDAENSLDKAKQEIFEIIGRDFNNKLKTVSEDNIDDINFEKSIQDLIDVSLNNNKEYLSKLKALQASEAALAESLGEHKPKLSFNLSMQKNSIGYDYTASQKNDVYVSSLQLSIPIYSGGSSYFRNKLHYESINKISEEVEAVRRAVIKNSMDVYNGFLSEKKRLEAIRAAIKSSLQARKAAEKSFEYGVIDVVELQDRINKEYKAKKEFNFSKFKLIKYYFDLNKLMGDINESHIQYIDDVFLIIEN